MILIVMGVAGCGKSTIGQQLADRLGWPFYDGDDFHPPANIQKMSEGIPLTDEDRSGWLITLADLIGNHVRHNQSAVIACSALKKKYRDILHVDASVRFVYLRGSYDLIEARLRQRSGHYMPSNLLSSQFASLEEPHGALTVDISLPPEQLVTEIIRQLRN
jgi:carbohydrate kinase (thermoresistant glucokinase family)